jgi:hypothetical protein
MAFIPQSRNAPGRGPPGAAPIGGIGYFDLGAFLAGLAGFALLASLAGFTGLLTFALSALAVVVAAIAGAAMMLSAAKEAMRLRFIVFTPFESSSEFEPAGFLEE